MAELDCPTLACILRGTFKALLLLIIPPGRHLVIPRAMEYEAPHLLTSELTRVEPSRGTEDKFPVRPRALIFTLEKFRISNRGMLVECCQNLEKADAR